jgi:WD40 repeat protein
MTMSRLFADAAVIVAVVGGGGMADEPPIRAPDIQITYPKGREHDRLFFSPDGTRLVGVGEDGSGGGVIDFWEVPSGKLVKTATHPAYISAAAFTPDGKRMVTACKDGNLRILVAPDWETEHAFDQEYRKDRTFFRLLVLPDGKRFVVGDYKTQMVWDIATRRPTSLPAEDLIIRTYAASPDGKRLVAGYGGPTAVVLDTEGFADVGRLTLGRGAEKQGTFNVLSYAPDGKTFAAVHSDVTGTKFAYHVSVWDARTLRQLCTYPECTYYPGWLTYTPDSKLLVANMHGPRAEGDPYWVCVWDAASCKLLLRFRISEKNCLRGAISPDGRWLMTADEDRIIRLHDFAKIRKEIGK